MKIMHLIILLSMLASASHAARAPDYQEEHERSLLSFLSAVSRNGDVLTIRTSSSPVVLKGIPGTPPRRLLTYFTLPSGRKDYLVSINGAEGVSCELVNGKTGARLQLAAAPILSPNGQLYLVASQDLDVGFSRNFVTILDADTYEQRFTTGWDESNPQVGPESAVWVTDDKVFFIEGTLDREATEKRRAQVTRKRMMVIEFIDHEWVGPREIN